MEELVAEIDNLWKMSKTNKTQELDLINDEFEKLIQKYPNNIFVTFQYNEFRIANLTKLSKKKPHILIGSPLSGVYPNFHQHSLFEVADVVCLIDHPLHYLSAIYSESFLFLDMLKRLPPGFKPDFYWDNQVEHKHLIIPGIQMAPFPIVASVCHTFYHKTMEHICELFDLVIPVSKWEGRLFKKKYPKKILDMPFGLNWGAFLNKPKWEKTIDLSITFGETNDPRYLGKRNKILELSHKFHRKYGNRFNIKFFDYLQHKEYLEVVKDSRIVLNVASVNGPYNYRTVEAMTCGALLFQYDWDDDIFENVFSEIFIDDVHGVAFNEENFEQKLLHYLEHPEESEKIAREGNAYVNEHFNYKKLYSELIQKVKEKEVPLPRDVKKANYHHLDMIYYNQNNDTLKLMNYGVIDQFHETTWIQLNNLMVLSMLYDSHSIGQFLFKSLAIELLNEMHETDSMKIATYLYEKALNKCPNQLRWLIQWNFLLIELENQIFNESHIKQLISLIENQEVAVFDEMAVIFKYYVNTSQFPNYSIENDEFMILNLNLKRVNDQPKRRMACYQKYMLKALHYFLENNLKMA